MCWRTGTKSNKHNYDLTCGLVRELRKRGVSIMGEKVFSMCHAAALPRRTGRPTEAAALKNVRSWGERPSRGPYQLVD